MLSAFQLTRRRKLSLYVPASFQRAILADKLSEASPVFNFFLHNARPAQISELSSIVGTYIGFEATPNHRALYEAFYGSLSEQRLLRGRNLDQTITEVLFEEWVFMQQQSWIVSRIRKSF